MYIVCDILQSLYDYPESDLEMMGTAKDYILTLYDNMIKIRDYYTRIVFFHQAYYQLERHYYDSAVTNALEEDAERISESFDDVLSFVDAIAADDIPNLLQAKQKYIKGLSGFISEEQEKQLDKLTICVTDKIKESILSLIHIFLSNVCRATSFYQMTLTLSLVFLGIVFISSFPEFAQLIVPYPVFRCRCKICGKRYKAQLILVGHF